MNSGSLMVCFDYTWQQDTPEELQSNSGGKSEELSSLDIVSRWKLKQVLLL
jgi:hypothetical protein